MNEPTTPLSTTPMLRFTSNRPRTVMLAIELSVLLAFLVLPWCVNDTLGDRRA